MNVARLYTREVVRIPRSSSIGEAASLMASRDVGFLLVVDDAPADRQALGVVTDRDLVVGALAEGLGPDDATVADVMKKKIDTVPAGADLHEALGLMKLGGHRRLAVTDDSGRIDGVLSIDDVVDGLAADLAGAAAILRVERVPA